MALPLSLQKAGYLTPEQIAKVMRLMVSVEGETNTGKTEFIMSGPGPVGILGLDRNIDGVMKNPKPPATRSKEIGIKLVCALGAGQADKPGYIQQWNEYYKEYREILTNPDVLTVGLDGDSDSWEIQRLAEFGTLTSIPSIMYDKINGARRAMIRRAWDSGKIVIASSKVTDIYEDKLDAEGKVVMGSSGKPVQVKSGDKRRQGFPDHKYLWQIQLRTLLRYVDHKGQSLPQWGIKILECKPRMELKGTELWADECNFASLVSLVYPHIELDSWGY